MGYCQTEPFKCNEKGRYQNAHVRPKQKKFLIFIELIKLYNVTGRQTTHSTHNDKGSKQKFLLPLNDLETWIKVKLVVSEYLHAKYTQQSYT